MKPTVPENHPLPPSGAKWRRVTREMVHVRTRELAAIAGRDSAHVLQIDYETARREVTGESDGDRQEILLDGPSG